MKKTSKKPQQLVDKSYKRKSRESDDGTKKLLKKYDERKRVPLGVIVLGVIIAIMLIPFLYKVIDNDAQIREKRAELETLLEKEKQLLLENEKLESYFEEDNFEEYLERQARDVMGYTDPGERVFNIQE